MRTRASSLAVLLVLVAGTLGCSADHGLPTVVASSDLIAAIATEALGDDAIVEVQTDATDPVDASLLDELAPIPFGEGPQWLGPPRRPLDDAVPETPAIGAPDPAFWLDPDRVVQAARLLAADVELDDAARQRTDQRLAALRETMLRADEHVQSLLLELSPDRRVVATSNRRLGYFAERYGLQILPADAPGLLGDLDTDHLGPAGSATATLDGLIVEAARRVASTQG